MTPAPEIGVHSAFEELYQLLRAIAAGRAPDRSEAVAYSTRRAVLLGAAQSRLLPGFVFQCMSVLRFRDFITLYDPDPMVRERFVRAAFERARSALESEGAFDSLQSAKPARRRWSM